MGSDFCISLTQGVMVALELQALKSMHQIRDIIRGVCD